MRLREPETHQTYKYVNAVHGQKLRVIKQQSDDGVDDRGLTEEKGKPQLLCLLVHVLTHFLVWCHDSLTLFLEFKTYTHEMDNLKEVTKVICHLEALLLSAQSQIRSHHNGENLLHFKCIEQCQLF